jgi:hypothetical protein
MDNFSVLVVLGTLYLNTTLKIRRCASKSLAGAMVVDLGCSEFASAYAVLVD